MSESATVVVLVRHGESVGNVDCAARRSDDPPLTERGRAQAARAAAALARGDVRALWSSPLRRARETAAAIAVAAGMPVHVAGELREVDMGTLAESVNASARAEREAILAA